MFLRYLLRHGLTCQIHRQILLFADDIAGSSFLCGNSDFSGLRARDGIKVPARYRSPASKNIKEDLKKCGNDKLVWLLRIRSEDIGVTVCGGKFGKTGIHAYASSLTFGASYGIKVHSVKYQNTFVDTLYIQTPAKNPRFKKGCT